MGTPITTFTSEGKAVTLRPKTAIRIPLASFRIKRQFTERLIADMFQVASGAKDGPGSHLDNLLRSWADAGCDLEAWAMKNPDKFWILRQTCDEWRVRPFNGLAPERGGFKPVLVGAVGLDATAETRDHPEIRVAYDTFAAFILTSGMVTRIGICDRCEKYYWNRWGHANKRFCGRKCSQLKTAAEGQAKKVAKQRQDKNRKIQKALGAFFWDKPAVADWKVWVAERARVTRTYLTRALNRGLREEPDGLKLTKLQVRYLESKGESHGNL